MYDDNDRVSTFRLRHDLVKGVCSCPLKTDLELIEFQEGASPCSKEGQAMVNRSYQRAKLYPGLEASYCGIWQHK